MTLALTAAIASPQAVIGARSDAPAAQQLKPNLEAARPLLGYVTDASNVLYSVVGSAARPQWGDPLALPDPAARTFLPPRQQFALVGSPQGLSIARLSRSSLYPGSVIPEAMPLPDRVTFSPSGEAAALFSISAGRIEVLSTRDAGRVFWSVPTSNGADLEQLTVSDDGQLLAARFAGQPAVFSSHGAPWQLLRTNYSPNAWTFLPNSHALVFSDKTARVIVVLPQADSSTLVERVLASGAIAPDLLSPNKEGSRLLLAKLGTSAAWSVDLLSGVISSLPVKDALESPTLLRDGETFLLSTKDAPVLVKLAATNTSH